MTIDNCFPTAVVINLEILSSLGHVQVTGFCLSFTAVNSQAFCCSRSLSHSQQRHACSIVFVVGQVPGCAISNVHYDAAVSVNIIAAGNSRVLVVQADFNITAIACIYVAFDGAGSFAAV